MADVPHNIEAEQALLGAVLIDPTVFTDVALIVTEPNMFYRGSHRAIFKAMQALREYGAEVDWVHVAETVGRAGDLDKCGGKEALNAYLVELSNIVPSAYGATGYAEIVRNQFALREIRFAGNHITNLSADPTKSPQEIIELLERKVVALDAISTSTSLERIGDNAQMIIVENAERKRLKETRGHVVAGMSSGFPEIDLYTGGWKGGEFIGLAARPGEGKTSLLLDIARRNMMCETPAPGLIFSLEMPKRTLRFKMLCNVAQVNTLAPGRGELTAEEEFRFEEAAETIARWPLYVERGRRGMTMRQIRSKCYQAVERFGVKWVMIDYLQYIKKRWFRMDTFEHVSECSRACKTLAGELDIPVIAAIQIKRQERKRGKEPVPTLDSFRGSGDIEQDVDGAWALYTRAFHKDRPCDIDLIALKTRLGETGTVALLFDRKTGRFDVPPVGDAYVAYKDYTDPQDRKEEPTLREGAEDDPRKFESVPKEAAREMFRTKEQGGKAIRL